MAFHVSTVFSSPTTLAVGKSLTVASIGVFAGIAVSFNTIIMPSLRKVSNQTALPIWANSYNTAKDLQVGLILTSLVAGSSVYYKTENPYFLAGSLIMTSIVPYTFGLLMPINRTLIGILEGTRTGKHSDDGNLDELFVKWDLLHFGRTIMSMVALGLTLYGTFSVKTFV
ncbi:hypothetical protein BGZ54_000648, partial [Gamsiella multidivaricata]